MITDYVSTDEDHNGTDLMAPCDYLNISRVDNITVTFTSYNAKNFLTTIKSYQSDTGVGKYEMIQRNTFDHENLTISMPLWIVDTDYSNYSVWSYCKNLIEGLYIGECLVQLVTIFFG